MTIALPDLFTLDETAVSEAHAYITQRISEYAPSIETKRGVLHDVLFHLEAILQTAQDVYADRLRKSGSLLAVTNDPTLAVDDVVDQIASNFRAARFPGKEATGTAVIILNAFVPSTVNSDVVFSASGQTYLPTAAFLGRIEQSQIVNPTDRLIKPVGDGTFYFEIELVAEAVGEAANIKKNTKLTPASTIPYFVTAYAKNSFSSGADYENNETFVKRLQEGIASKNVSNRITLNALLRDQEAFKSILVVSTAGYGDPEQIRYHSVFPVASGNRLDVYLRPSAKPKVIRLEKTATLLGRQGGGGLWQVSILKDDLPGFYNVDKVVKATVVDGDTETGLEITEDIRGFNLAADTSGFIPDIVNAVEAAYSPYQTAIIRFIDTTTDPALAVGSTLSYAFYLRGMSLIKEAQDFLGGRDVRPTAGDLLVKAAVPCDLRLSFVVYKKISDPAIDTAGISTALADTVNNIGFIGRLAASTLHSVIHSYLSAGQTVSAIEMFGTILGPDGIKRYIRNFNVLEIPNEPSNMVSARTTAFILDPSDVGISVQNIDSSVI